jgi:hypothetical protein
MSTEDTAIRLAGKLAHLTAAGKLTWVDAGRLGPWGDWPGQVFKASVEDGTFAQIAEIPLPRSLITSYYFGVAEGNPEIFEVNVQGRPDEIFGVFAEGYPADPTDEKLKLLSSLKVLYAAARESAKGTREKVEKFEQLLERMA